MNAESNAAKLCQVCGDNAAGINYNVLSCDPCKAFFRRNAYKQGQLICFKEENCYIDKNSRKRCKLCRLNKCFAIGMKKEDVLENSDDDAFENDIVHLTEYELEKLREIQAAMSIFVEETNFEVAGQATSLAEAFNLPGNYVLKIAKFCKNIKAFNQLKPCDQICSMKQFFVYFVLIRISFLYDNEKDGFLIPIENELQYKAIHVNLSTLSREWKKIDIGSILRKFSSALKLEMENDCAIRDLIITKYLFKNVQNIACPEFKRYQYFVYRRLLKRYLHWKYKSPNKADRKYSALKCILAEVKYIRQIIDDIYATLELTCQLAHVLAEIFNLL